jgi:streptogramin lyase
VVFTGLLLILSAVPVFAAESSTTPIEGATLAPTSLGTQANWLPDAAEVAEGLAAIAREEATRKHELASAEAVREREESRDAFVNMDAAGARELLQVVFEEQLEKLNTDPARSLSGAEIVRTAGETVATVTEDGDGALLDAGIPVKTEDDEGDLRKVDLGLKETAEGFETTNALSRVRVGNSADEPIEVGEEGISISQLGAAEANDAQRFGEQNIFHFEALTDTDTLVSPTAFGVEIFNLLRSEKSPETLRFEIALPDGAELRADGRGGAEIARKDETLAAIPFPTAVDAQGTDVPVELSIEGNSIALHVEHREGDYAMPILVDPAILEDWVNSNQSWINGYNLNALSNGAWQWTSSPYGLIYFGTSCFYTCWGSGRGLYVSAPSRNYGANTYSHWAYSAPNLGSYISKAWLIPFWRDDHGCSQGQYPNPHDYDGFWGDNQWNLLQTNQAINVGSVAVQSWGRAFIVGLHSGGGINIPCWRDLVVGGAAMWLDDWNQPVLTTSSTGQWMDSSPVRLNVRASDGGLGVRKFEAEAVNKSGATQKWETWHPCIGTYASRCPETWNLADTSQPQLAYDPAVLPEGINTLNVTAFDAVLRKSTTTNGMTVRVDHAAPTIKLSGTITEQAAVGTEKPKYTVRVETSDGVPNDTNPANARSGVVSISEWVDGNKVNEYAPGCPTQSCSWFDEGEIQASAYSKGKHMLTIKATDALGHIASQQLEFTLGDTQAPALNVTGLPTESSAMPTRTAYWKTFGANGSGDGQLKSPADVAIDAQGDLWVADRGNNTIQKFSSSGQFLTKFGSAGSANGQFSSPAAIAIDPKGNIWVADKGNSRVQKFNAKGEYLAQFGSKGTGNGQFASGGPEGIAIDPKGNVWVSDTYAGRVQKFNENGNFLKVVSSKGSGVGQLGEPTGIDIGPNGKVWVTDWQNNRVAVFNESGEFLTQFGSTGTGNGQFDRPDAIAVGNRGDVWVGDQNNGRVQEFDQNGIYVGQFGSKGSGPGQFSFAYPMGVTTDSKGSVWVADTNNHRIQRWLVPNTTVSGYLEPLKAAASDAGHGVASIAVKLTNQAGETEVLGQTSQLCSEGGCPLDYELEELDLSGKPSGTYMLTVVATDVAGNVREDSRVLSLDSTPPELELGGPLAESAGLPLNAASAELEIAASDSDPASGGISQINVERDGQLVASHPSDCSDACYEAEASYVYHRIEDGADRQIQPVAEVEEGSVGELADVSCATESDCWALGRTRYEAAELGEGKTPAPLLEHWDGTEWQAVAVPKPTNATDVYLDGIVCKSMSFCRAVGHFHNGSVNLPLIELWNGTKWTAAAPGLPSGASAASIVGISCGAANNTSCWMISRTEVSPAEIAEGKKATTYLYRWTGTAWQAVTAPKPAGASDVFLADIDCSSATACQAVGHSSTGSTNQPLRELWDGTQWSASNVPLPSGASGASLNGISCASASHCWALGKTQVTLAEQTEGKAAVPFFEHWNGSEWQVEETAAAPDGSPTTVTSISCAAATACTAVGRYTNVHGETLPLAYTWDGIGWRFQPMPIKTEANNSSLEGVSCSAANECASVGYSRIDSGQWQVLAEAELPGGGPHEITVEAVDVQGNATSETIEIDLDASPASAPECDAEPKLKAAQGILTPAQAIDSIEEALPAAVAPTDGATAPTTEETIDPSYSVPSPNLETVHSLATGETSVTPEGGFTLGDSVCFTPGTLTPAATDATVVSGDAALFANTAPEADTVIRPTAMGTTVIHSLRGPNAPDSFVWNVRLSAGQDLVELPSGAVAVVETGVHAEEVAQVPSPPEKSADSLADVEVQVENGEYELINAAEETQLEVVAVIARPWVVLAQGGIMPALIEIVPDTETPNEFEMFIWPPETPEEAAVWPAQLIIDAASASSVNGSCSVAESPCGALDLNKAAQYAVYWGNEGHHSARNPYYHDYGSNNCTNFISQILRAGGAKFMRAFEHGDGSWWYRNLSNGMFAPPDSGWDDTESWRLADELPRHLWRFGLAHIDPIQQPWGWTKGNIIALDWFGTNGKGDINHLVFVVGQRHDPGGGREPLLANHSTLSYPNKPWDAVKRRIEDVEGSSWTRFALAARHRAANPKAKKHDPDNLYGANGLFG